MAAATSTRAGKQAPSCSELTEAEGFEAFCQKRYVGTKRFGLEGGEVTIPALHAMIEHRGAMPASTRSSSACRIAAG